MGSDQGYSAGTLQANFALYRERNLIERFFNKIKHFRAIATRYFLAAVQLVSAIILLN
jgi:transposase